MRLIALAQGSPLRGTNGEGPGQALTTNLSMSSLEASRYISLPPPRMAGVPTAAGTVPAEARPSAAVASSSPTASPAAAAAAGEGGVGASGTTAIDAAAALRGGAPNVFSTLGGGGSGGVGGIGLGHVAGVGSVPLSFTSSLVASSMGGLQQPPFAGALPTVTPAVPPSALAGGGLDEEHGQGETARRVENSGGREKDRPGEKEEEEEDFGDFAGAQEGVSAERGPPPRQQSIEDDDDGFGDFSSAPSGGEAAVTASAATLAAAGAATANSGCAEGKSPGLTVPVDPWFGPAAAPAPAVSGGGGDGSGGTGVGDDEAWMKGGSEGRVASPAGGGRSKDGLDSLIKSNLQAATSGPIHLADMVCRVFFWPLDCGVCSSPCKNQQHSSVFVSSAVFAVGVTACLIRSDSKVYPTLWYVVGHCVRCASSVVSGPPLSTTYFGRTFGYSNTSKTLKIGLVEVTASVVVVRNSVIETSGIP